MVENTEVKCERKEFITVLMEICAGSLAKQTTYILSAGL